MVTLTVYIEGTNPDVPGAETSLLFRESFSKLFSQLLPRKDFNLIIEPIGSVTQSKSYLEKIINERIEGVLLIDLETSKNNKEEKLSFYSPLDTSRIFFMIQEMEAWILSQPEKILAFGLQENYIKKQPSISIEDNILLKNILPEEIEKPSGKLDTILRQHFEVIRNKRGGKKTRTGLRYIKLKHGPILIELLDLNILMNTFEDVNNLIRFIKDKNHT